MSAWAQVDAEFNGSRCTVLNIQSDMPTGSESGPDVRQLNDTEVWVRGGLRDFYDLPGAFQVLAWFVTKSDLYADTATLELEFDTGHSYNFSWSEGALKRERGVLDL